MKPSVMIAALAAVLSTTSVAIPALAHPGEEHAPTTQAAEAPGVVKAVDMDAGVVTLQHGPIPALNLPAATTQFRVNPAMLLDAVKVGDKVSFELTMADGSAEVTAIQPN